jgi:tetratricopeptide (TPR) repeat protein
MRASPGGFVLVTSRVDDPAQWAPARVHRIGELEGSAASEALADHAGADGPAGLAGAEELARRLGGVPLALSLAGRILATHRVLFPDAHALLARLGGDVGALDELAAPLLRGAEAERRLLSGVWELSLRLVEEREPRAVPLLKLLAVLGPEAVGVPLRRLPLSELDGGVLGSLTDADMARTVNALVVHGLVSVVSPQGETALRLHPLVSETVRAGLGTADLALVEQAERLLAWQRDQDFVFEAGAYRTIIELRIRLHPTDLGSIAEVAVAGVRSFLEAFTRLNRLLIILGRADQAEENLVRFLEHAGRTHGVHDPQVLRLRHHRAEAWRLQGRVDDAEAEYLDILALSTEHHGADHENALEARFQLALVSIQREEWDMAIAGFLALRNDWRRLSGPEEPRALAAWENMAYAVMCKGDLLSAEQGFREVRLIRARTMGERHPLTAQADYYLARVAFEGGDPETAQRLFEACLRVREQALGKNHPDTERARKWRDRVVGKPQVDR